MYSLNKVLIYYPKFVFITKNTPLLIASEKKVVHKFKQLQEGFDDFVSDYDTLEENEGSQQLYTKVSFYCFSFILHTSFLSQNVLQT